MRVLPSGDVVRRAAGEETNGARRRQLCARLARPTPRYSIANAQHPQGRSPVSFYTLDLGTQGPQHLPLVNCAGDDDLAEKDVRCTG